MGLLQARPIEGFPGYLISPEGIVIGLERTVNVGRNGICLQKIPSRIMKLWINWKKGGYVHASLSKNNKTTHKQVHRLVATAFIPNPNSLSETNHKNGIKTDNRVENLEWSTRSDNLKHSYRVLGRKHSPMIKKRTPILEDIPKDAPLP